MSIRSTQEAPRNQFESYYEGYRFILVLLMRAWEDIEKYVKGTNWNSIRVTVELLEEAPYIGAGEGRKTDQ